MMKSGIGSWPVVVRATQAGSLYLVFLASSAMGDVSDAAWF